MKQDMEICMGDQHSENEKYLYISTIKSSVVSAEDQMAH
jgi:hypothetical protein